MEGLKNILHKFINTILQFLFPSKKSEQLMEKISASEFRNRVSAPIKQQDKINSLFSYKEPLVRDLIWLVKYKKRDFAIKLSAELLLDDLLEEISEQMAFSGNQKTLLIPIPISKNRMKERGYNQMEMIAEKIMSMGGSECFEYLPNVLVKIRETKSQTSIKNRKERLENVVGCFGIKNGEKIKGRNILVIDDVTTTGATLLEAKKVLKKFAGRKIELISIAH